MKKLLLSSVLMLGSLFSFAQTDCAAALTLAEGVTTSPAITTGIYATNCINSTAPDGGGTMYGRWYKFVAVTSGEVEITSDLPQNVAPFSVDTRISVFSGTCSALVCHATSDDVSATNFLTTVSFPVAAGATYYIQWDNFWSGLGFDFSTTFTAMTCLRPYNFNAPTNVLPTSITLNWDASLSAPLNYELEYGPAGFTQGSGTLLSPAPTTNSATISGLTTETSYDFYIRSVCGVGNESDWSPVQNFLTPKTCPEAMGFDSNAELLGWTTIGNGAYGLGTAAANAQAGTQYWIFNNSITAVTDNWLMSPAFYLQANEQVTISFWERNATAQGNRRMRVTVGNAPTIAAQTTQIYNNAALLNNTYAQITTPTFTAPTAGIYYFGFNDNSVQATVVSTMRVDTINFTSVLGTDNFLSSKFSVYPNPANNVINFTNDANAVVSSVEMTDLNGRTVKSVKVDATEGQIAIGDLATGMYIMNINSDQGVVTKKIVKR